MKNTVSSSKFAENQLKKFGWKEGDGIGKNSQGMINPIKVAFKFDTSGVGFDHSEQFTTNWWENLYNSSAKGITNEVKPTEQVIEKIPKRKYFNRRQEFRRGKKARTGRGEKKEIPKLPKISDEELYKFCEGRTAHKGARHGIKMNGKLARIEEQERILAEKLKNKLEEDENKPEKKKKKRKEKSEEEIQNTELGEDQNDQELTVKKKKKKSKKSSEQNE